MKSKTLIDKLFTSKKGKVHTVYPIRMVSLEVDIARDAPGGDGKSRCPVRVLFSVSKRHFKHAVDRNRVKRQVREAFRRNKSIITQNLTDDHEAVAMAFVWLTNEKYPSSEVENRMVRLLTRISECL